MTTPNVELLTEIAQWVHNQHAKEPSLFKRTLDAERHPDPTTLVWDQTRWYRKLNDVGYSAKDCGTACCVAGYVAVTDPDVVQIHYGTDVEVDGQFLTIRSHARNRLGLTEEEADELFNGQNSAQDVLAIIDNIIGETQ